MSENKVIILATEGATTQLLFAGMKHCTTHVSVVLENPISKKTILKRRIKKIGFLKTAGQVAFLTAILPFIPTRKKRIAELIASSNLNLKPLDEDRIVRISSINDRSFIDFIKNENPDLIVVNGTRILSKNLLQSITCPIVNVHVGITPQYRGVHGGFWAIKEGNTALFGVTLHYVDSGIDTGPIIAQKILEPTKQDNFKTYPILQYTAGIELLQSNFNAIIEGKTEPKESLTTKSKLHYHPTWIEYLF